MKMLTVKSTRFSLIGAVVSKGLSYAGWLAVVGGMLGAFAVTPADAVVQVAFCDQIVTVNCCGNSIVEPANNEQCDPAGACCTFNCQFQDCGTPTQTPVPTATETPVPTATETPVPTPTNTSAGIVFCADPLDLDCCGNSIVEPANNEQCDPAGPCCTFNCQFQDCGTPTNTPIPTATNTPIPTATNTLIPTATNTPIPTATNTPIPTATNTPIPTATNTPLPTATNTPVPTATSGGIMFCLSPGDPNCCGNNVIDAANGEQCDVFPDNPNNCCTSNCQLESATYQCGADPCQVCGNSVVPANPVCPVSAACTPTITPTITPTATTTPTTTNTPLPTNTRTPTETLPPSPTRTPTGSTGIGEDCTDPSECLGFLFCVDGVCCTTPCDGPGESCDLPDREGFCSRPQIAPAMSWPAQAAAAGVLMMLAWLGLQAMRRRA